MSAPTKPKSPRAGVLLMMYFGSCVAATRAVDHEASAAYQLGAMSVPFILLVAGTWFAFKEGGWLSKTFASIFVTLSLVGFGIGVSEQIAGPRSTHEIDAEIAQIQDAALEDAADETLGPEAGRRHLDRTQDAARRMQGSADAETAALGRAMELVTEVTRGPQEDLITAMELVASERFLDVRAMVTPADFAWQRETVHAYRDAAKNGAIFNETMVGVVAKKLQGAGLSAGAFKGLMKGVEKSQPLNARLFQGHIRAASRYEALVDYIELHRSELTTLEDGTVQSADPAVEKGYMDILGTMRAAEAEIDRAAERLVNTFAKR